MRLTNSDEVQITNYPIAKLQNQKQLRRRSPLRLPPLSCEGKMPSRQPAGRRRYVVHQAALLGPLPSSVFWPTFTLICFGFASAFLGS